MNCYFLSFGNKKELERIKKRLQRKRIKYTLNKENLFIVYYSYQPLDLPETAQSEVKLHKNHIMNQPVEVDPRMRSLFSSENVPPKETFNTYDIASNSVEQVKKEIERLLGVEITNKEQQKNIYFTINRYYDLLGLKIIYATDIKNLNEYLTWKYGEIEVIHNNNNKYKIDFSKPLEPGLFDNHYTYTLKTPIYSKYSDSYQYKASFEYRVKSIEKTA